MTPRGKRLFMIAACAWSLGVLTGCTTSAAHGGGALDGTVRGQTYSFVDSISGPVAWSAGGYDGQKAEIVLSSIGGACADAQSGTVRKGEEFVVIWLGQASGTSVVTPTPGTYSIEANSGNIAEWSLFSLDATCMDTGSMDANAIAGSVVLASASGDVFSGQFDLTLDSGDHVTGTFEPAPCAATANVGLGNNCQ